MISFFNLIYIVPNRFADEKIAVAILANIDGIPYFAFSERKLVFAMTGFTNDLKISLRKGFRYMDVDVNKIRRGEQALSLFDPPFAKKILAELAHKKRGVLVYSDLFEINQPAKKRTQDQLFDQLYRKFLQEDREIAINKPKSPSFKVRFRSFTAQAKFKDFEANFVLQANVYPYIYSDVTIDLCRKSHFFTVFQTVDFSKTIQNIQNQVSQFRIIVQSLQQKSITEGLSTGRYYLIYEPPTNTAKLALLNALKEEKKVGFKMIRMSEIKDTL